MGTGKYTKKPISYVTRIATALGICEHKQTSADAVLGGLDIFVLEYAAELREKADKYESLLKSRSGESWLEQACENCKKPRTIQHFNGPFCKCLKENK